MHFVTDEQEDEEMSFVDQILKKPRLDTNYMDLKFVPPTSNIVERLFSQAKLYMTPLRKSMEPKHLEMLLFLRCNRNLWDEKLLLCAYNEEKAKK